MNMSITLEGEIKNVTLVGLATISCLCYCHFISAKLPKGKWRLISLVPIFCVFTILPLYTTTVFFTVGAATFLTWLANFKLLLFAFDRGPLASFNNINLPIFITMAALPFKIKPKKPSKKLELVSGEARIQELGKPDSDGAPKSKSRFNIPYMHGIILNLDSLISRLYVAPPLKLLTLSLATEILIFVIVISILHECNKYTHPHIVVFLLYWCFAFLFIELVCESSSLIVYLLLGLELHPPSNKPYLSTSLQDFWGRRWNLTINHIMRETVYKPVRSAAAVVLGRDWAAAAVAVVATFHVSGIVHELMLWYVTRGSPSWEITVFFVFHGVCVVVEFGLKEVLVGMKWRLPPVFVSRLLTVGFVVVTSFWMLWPPVRKSGADVRAIEELRLVGEVAKECVVEVWGRVGCKWA